MAKRNYVNNPEFLEAIIAYKKLCSDAEDSGDKRPQIPNYIGQCIYQISTRLASKPNFSGYSYKDEMICDGLENAIQALGNFDPNKSHNPFAYFTQIIWYAFLRRIEKEKKQQDIKLKYLSESGMEMLVAEEIDNNQASQQTQAFVDELRQRIDYVKDSDRSIKKYSKEVKQKKKRTRHADSDLSEFMSDEKPCE